MTEQVINIRDRIERMRTQMTGSKEAVVKKKAEIQSPINKPLNPDSIKTEDFIESKSKADKETNIKNLSVSQVEKEKIEKISSEVKFEKKIEESQRKIDEDNFHNQNKKSQRNFSNKTYKDYQNENIFDENKKSVKLDENQAFPQFNLNVSNPISWKLMLLIMLMQLLTNIMLVVVLYLK
ncbi:MAG: hypothetical protein CMP43_03590 [Rickettsiales bacterium]|nr:hypothetical protein [Rickettsiales bacterium]